MRRARWPTRPDRCRCRPGPIERYSDRAAIGSLGALRSCSASTREPAPRVGSPAHRHSEGGDAGARGVRRATRPRARRARRDHDGPGRAAPPRPRRHARARRARRDVGSLVDRRGRAVRRTRRHRASARCAPADCSIPRTDPTCAVAGRVDARAARRRGATCRAARRPAAALIGAGGRRVLGLWRGDELRAFVAVVEEPAPLADELVEAAETAGLEVFLAGGTDAFARRLDIAQRLVVGPPRRGAPGSATRGSRRRCSSRVTTPHALRAADIGLGVEVRGEPVPWGARPVVGAGLANAWRVVDAVAHGARREPAQRAARARAARRPVASGRSRARRAQRGAASAAPDQRRPRWSRSRWVASPASQAGNRRFRAPGPGTRGTSSTPTRRSNCSRARPTGSRPSEQARRRATSTRTRRRARRSGLVRAAVDELANPLTPVLALGAGALGRGRVDHRRRAGGRRGRRERARRRRAAGADRTLAARARGDGRRARPGARRRRGPRAAGRLARRRRRHRARQPARRCPPTAGCLEAVALEVDESAITGESLPVAKTVEATPGAPVAERTSMLYEGSAIAAGRAVALVVAVGRDTEAGRSAAAAAASRRLRASKHASGALTRLTVPVTVASGRARHRARASCIGARHATPSVRASRSRSLRCPKGSRRSRRSRKSRRPAGSRHATRWCATRARSRRSAASTRSASTRPAR